jgi:hypothetical protein
MTGRALFHAVSSVAARRCLTLIGFDGASHTVDVTVQTRYQKAGASAALSDASTGTAFGGGRHYRFGDGGVGFRNGGANGSAPGATALAATGTQNI